MIITNGEIEGWIFALPWCLENRDDIRKKTKRIIGTGSIQQMVEFNKWFPIIEIIGFNNC